MPMGSMTIRNLDDRVKARLRVRAAQRGHSMEEEARNILQTALEGDDLTGARLVADIRALVNRYGGVDIELPKREPMRDPPDFSA